MKLNNKGYRVTKNGTIMKTIEKEAVKEDMYLGPQIKVDGTYYFFNRKQGEVYVYLP